MDSNFTKGVFSENSVEFAKFALRKSQKKRAAKAPQYALCIMHFALKILCINEVI